MVEPGWPRGINASKLEPTGSSFHAMMKRAEARILERDVHVASLWHGQDASMHSGVVTKTRRTFRTAALALI